MALPASSLIRQVVWRTLSGTTICLSVKSCWPAWAGVLQASDTVATSLGKIYCKGTRQRDGINWFGPGRYYCGYHGRFTSVEPLSASAKTADPQTWNRYAYALNRPTIAIDPDGLSTIIVVVNPRKSKGNGKRQLW